ncbi:MAG: M48 family metallopeptidase [Magnetococcales bacterium]|nr:M48 family metallopeptidase [Magnetococcales bacterium]
MNSYALVILIALIAGYLLNIISNWLNSRAMRADPPEQFTDLVSPQDYEKNRNYSAANTRVELLEETASLIGLLLFWFFGGFGWLDTELRALGLDTLYTGLLFFGALIMMGQVLSLPFSLYQTFRIEAEYGFNRTSLATFFMDRIKGLALMVLLGGPALWLVLWLLVQGGEQAWLYGWGAVSGVIVVIQFVAPNWLMPLFMKFTPLEEGGLRQAIMTYAQSVKFALSDIYEIDGSRRSSKGNAFFTGFGKNRRIALYDTLIEKHTESELVAVLAHEVGHFKHRHIPKTLIMGLLHLGVMFFLLSFFLNEHGLFAAFDTMPSVYAGLTFFLMLYTPVELIIGPFFKLISRRFEFQADRFAATTLSDPLSLVTALKKLAVDNLSNLTPHPFYVILHYTHPPLLERIQAIRDVNNERDG